MPPKKGSKGTFLGHHHTKKSKRSISKTKRKLFAEGKRVPWNKGKKGYKQKSWTEERKQRQREFLSKLAKTQTGKNSPKWKGGIKLCKARSNRKSYAKRKSFGFEFLNEWFEESEAHHIDKQHIVFIPKELHRSVWHSLEDLETMEKINTKVFCWLLGKCV
jgi:hypothetical protein